MAKGWSSLEGLCSLPVWLPTGAPNWPLWAGGPSRGPNLAAGLFLVRQPADWNGGSVLVILDAQYLLPLYRAKACGERGSELRPGNQHIQEPWLTPPDPLPSLLDPL